METPFHNQKPDKGEKIPFLKDAKIHNVFQGFHPTNEAMPHGVNATLGEYLDTIRAIKGNHHQNVEYEKRANELRDQLKEDLGEDVLQEILQEQAEFDRMDVKPKENL